MIGQTIGNYRILRLLGEGGMGSVYEARNDQIGRRAAIKVLRPELAHNAEVVARFLNEARAANLVQHPGIVDIYEYGQAPSGATFIVMQYLDGESLRARLKRRGALGPDALRLGRQIAAALAVAHDQKIIHRDLKPENVMVVADADAAGGERAKVLDFGIAKLAAELKPAGEQLTHTGVMLGTPAYMAPEQCRGQSDLNDRADVYSLGVMLFEMTAGVKPFVGDMGELIAAHLYRAPPTLAGAPELDALLQRMLNKAPAERPSMRQVGAELERLGALPTGITPAPALIALDPEPLLTVRAALRRPAFLGALLAVLVVLLGAAGLTLRAQGPRAPVVIGAAVQTPERSAQRPVEGSDAPRAPRALPPLTAAALSAGEPPRAAAPLPQPSAAPRGRGAERRTRHASARPAPTVSPKPPDPHDPDEADYVPKILH